MYAVDYQEAYIKNCRGTSLFTCRWIPHPPIKALVFLCHGFGMECSGYMRECGLKLGGAGYAVFGIDYEGHGRSKGIRCYIKNIDDVVDDCECYFKSICEKESYKEKGRFFYGESMGAAVALLVHRKDPAFWNGGVLLAPMCKLAKEIMPSKAMLNIMSKVEDIVPKWKLCPFRELIQKGFKDPLKREEVKSNKLIYHGKIMLRTCGELYRTASYLEETLHEVTLPFLVLHGEKDIVVDPEVSRTLYNLAGSSDKSIKIYPDMWHALTTGEPDENVEIVFSDVIAWLDQRAPQSVPLAPEQGGYVWAKENGVVSARLPDNCHSVGEESGNFDPSVSEAEN